MEQTIVVNMADYKLARGKQKLITRDLGSCVAVAMRDAQRGIGGLLHVMLPECADPGCVKQTEYPKYADIGIELMVKQMILAGASRTGMTAKLAGAAHIVRTEYVPVSEDISSRNLEAVKRKLATLGIPILAMEVEDEYPRTVVFEPESGIMQIKTRGMADRFI